MNRGMNGACEVVGPRSRASNDQKDEHVENRLPGHRRDWFVAVFEKKGGFLRVWLNQANVPFW